MADPVLEATSVERRLASVARRLVGFHAICGPSLVWAVLLLHLFRTVLRINLYVTNLLAIVLATVWDLWLNARFNWKRPSQRDAC